MDLLCLHAEIAALMINIITTSGMIMQVMTLIKDKVKCTGVQRLVTWMRRKCQKWFVFVVFF